MKSAQWYIPWVQHDSTSCFENYLHSIDEVPAFFCNPNDTIGDSLLVHQVKSSEIHYSESILATNQPKDLTYKRVENAPLSWPFFIICISLVLLGISLVFSFSRIHQAFKAAFSLRETGIFIRNFPIHRSISTIITYINTYILLALLIILFVEKQFGAEPEIKNFLFIFGGLLTYQIIKNTLIYISKNLFNTIEETELYIYRDYFTKNIANTLALPFVFASFYSPFQIFFLILSVVIFLYSYGHQLILAIITGYSNSRYSFFYFILYFCSVEILPLLVGAKILINNDLIIW